VELHRAIPSHPAEMSLKSPHSPACAKEACRINAIHLDRIPSSTTDRLLWVSARFAASPT